ncbi:MAG: UDP-N-acetylmuramoyl-L-alanine--D-glutamate ligase, partial [Anaerolineales bacterium]
GTALARYLVQRGAQVVINDRRTASELQDVQDALSDQEERFPGSLKWVFGGHPLELLHGIDVLCVSGGVPLTLPLVLEAQRRGIPLSNDSQIFMENVPCKVIGITGSAGKTTTTSLVGRIAEKDATAQVGSSSYRRAWVGGNIGSPLISVLDQMSADDLVVMELSSFQLELMSVSPQVAVLLNITPNHLDRHGSMEAYTAAKSRIIAFQSRSDTAVLGRDDPGAWELADRVTGRLVSFGISEARLDRQAGDAFLWNGDLYFRTAQETIWLMSQSTIRLRGAHNLLNYLAACAIGMSTGLGLEAIRSGAAEFSGVAHRLEFVRSWGGADWYNDSIATAPERTIAAVRSFDEPLVLLLGGRDKDLPWDALADLVLERIEHLIAFGEAAEKILQTVARSASRKGVEIQPGWLSHCKGLRQAVEVASRVVRPGNVVLLSPGGTSFDEFSDFEERGECFRQLVMQL